jgi:aminoglycoside phosphotransferase (APT) family kinase protein
MDRNIAETPARALIIHGRHPGLGCERVVPGGLINTTWLVGAPPSLVLQRINPIFPQTIHGRIQEVTGHLVARGLPTPRIVPALDGRLVIPGPDGSCWRLMDFVPGYTLDRVDSPARAADAAELVGRFHQALLDFPGPLHPLRPDPHDTPRHMALLEQTLLGCEQHRLCDAVRPLGAEVLAGWERWQARFGGQDLPVRPAHGDLKISNLRFDAQGSARCLIDLDTLSSMPLALELGDAMRSWCNRAGEDGQGVGVDLAIFEAALGGYRQGAAFVTDEEIASIAPGTWRICLELAARFGADAIRECYFGWDPGIAPGRGEHNLLRARSQLALARAVEAQLPQLERIAAAP